MPLRLRRGGESTWVAATAEARGGDLVVTLRGRASVRMSSLTAGVGATVAALSMDSNYVAKRAGKG